MATAAMGECEARGLDRRTCELFQRKVYEDYVAVKGQYRHFLLLLYMIAPIPLTSPESRFSNLAN